MPNDIKSVKTIPNVYGDLSIKISEPVPFYCLGGPSMAIIIVNYTPDKLIMELDSYHKWITTHFRIQTGKDNPQPLEGIVTAVETLLLKHLEPKKLVVIGTGTSSAKERAFWEEILESKRHGPIEVSKSFP